MRIIRAFVAKPLELPFSRLFRRLFFAWLKCREIKQSQKIAAFGSSYIGMRSPVGAAEGCDLLILIFTNPETKTANPKVSRC